MASKTRFKSFTKCLPNKQLYKGKYEPGDDPATRDLKALPEWFDPDLARRGQLFAQNHLYSMAYSNVIGLFFSLGGKELTRFLKYTGKSDTGEKAYNRYLPTVLQTVLWYYAPIGDDMSSPFFTSLRNVRRIHFKVGRRVQNEAPDFSKPLIKDPEDEPGAPDPLWKSFRNDFSRSEFGKQCRDSDFKREIEGRPQYYLSQLDMAQTLWDFSAVVFLFKEQFGLADVDEEDWMGFIHLWAIVGHCLGISPDYNICIQQDLEGFKDVAQYMLVHNLSGLNEVAFENQVMWRALTEGLYRLFPLANLEVILVTILEDMLGIEATETKRHLNYTNRLQIQFQKYAFHPLLKYQFLRHYINGFVLQSAEKQAVAHYGFSGFDHQKVASKAFYY